MSLRPLRDHVIVKLIEPELKTANGLVLTKPVDEKIERAEVISVGERFSTDGTQVPSDIAEGDVVVFTKHGGSAMQIDGEDLVRLHHSEILATVG